MLLQPKEEYMTFLHSSDVTEQKRIEEQLRQSQKMEIIGTLAGGIAHDFNNILTAMIGFSELAAGEIPAGSRAHRRLKMVHEAGLRGRDLVRQIMAFSRKSEAEPKQTRLTPLIHETRALLRACLPTTVRMSLAITTGDDYVRADPTQIQQVLINLATNAAHAMQGPGQLMIGISSVTFPRGSLLPDPGMEPGAYVKLMVKDTGTGMTEEVRQRIFEPFFTTKVPGKGTGLGLAVVDGIVRSHGGTVTVQSEVGKGSTFTVFLPLAQKPEIDQEEEATAALPTGAERILFADGEETLLEMVQNMLESLGYNVTVAKHPTNARNLFLEDPSRFDLVITDQAIPDATRVMPAQEVLRVREKMPAILCTGCSETVSADQATEAGIREFVIKPMAKKEPAETVRRVPDGREEHPTSNSGMVRVL
jgi:nitrogen-specific signal transduction histidine kinase/ActR/RegA family two-component response regulator